VNGSSQVRVTYVCPRDNFYNLTRTSVAFVHHALKNPSESAEWVIDARVWYCASASYVRVGQTVDPRRLFTVNRASTVYIDRSIGIYIYTR